jgi:dTDP-4-amino-4,6-dideoxygalactose transaminase
MVHDQLVNHVDEWMSEREDSLRRLSRFLNALPGLRAPVIRETTTKMGAWYGYKPWINFGELGISRKKIASALEAEGIEVSIPASPPLHELALFNSSKFAIRSYSKFDNSQSSFPGADKYSRGLLSLPTYTGSRDEALLQNTMRAFEKVWNHLEDLR